ncbi:hypothetical protein LZ023_04515 [Pseudomonas silvicola]|nr:hypothetical protein LZ023_04515 [Pseudomonas silvicola]
MRKFLLSLLNSILSGVLVHFVIALTPDPSVVRQDFYGVVAQSGTDTSCMIRI